MDHNVSSPSEPSLAAAPQSSAARILSIICCVHTLPTLPAAGPATAHHKCHAIAKPSCYAEAEKTPSNRPRRALTLRAVIDRAPVLNKDPLHFYCVPSATTFRSRARNRSPP